MPLTQDERALYSSAQKGVELGTLPRVAPRFIWAGRGSGGPCSLCAKPLEAGEIEYEVQDGPDQAFRFHLRCHAIWQLALPPSAADGHGTIISSL